MNDAANPAAYIAAVLTLYVDLPDTPLRASVSDQWLARRFYDDGVPLSTVETALLLGSLRRLIRPAGAPRLSPIRSLAYFRRVFEELPGASRACWISRLPSPQTPPGSHNPAGRPQKTYVF